MEGGLRGRRFSGLATLTCWRVLFFTIFFWGLLMKVEGVVTRLVKV